MAKWNAASCDGASVSRLTSDASLDLHPNDEKHMVPYGGLGHFRAIHHSILDTPDLRSKQYTRSYLRSVSYAAEVSCRRVLAMATICALYSDVARTYIDNNAQTVVPEADQY